MDISFSDFMCNLEKIDQATTTSIASFTKSSDVRSPMFIDDTLTEEPAIKNLTNNLYSIYIGYILTALNLNEKVAGNRTVRDIMGTVSTDTNIFGSQESFMDIDTIMGKLTGDMEATARIADPKKMKSPLPVGRIVEVDFNTDSGDKVSASFTVRLTPRVIPSSVVKHVIDADFNESMVNRYLRMTAGELSFFKDFLFQMDRATRKVDALKDDKSNALIDIYRNKNKSRLRQLLKIAMNKTAQVNMANAVFIMDAKSVNRITKAKGVSFDKVADRRRFFDSTFALFVCLVDTDYSRVKIYTNGIDDVGDYSFNDLKAPSESDDLKDIVSAFSKQQIPKF